MWLKLTSLFERDMTVYYITQVQKQGINIKVVCPN